MQNLIHSIYNAIVFSAHTPKIIERAAIKNIRSMHSMTLVGSSSCFRKPQLLVDVSVIFHSDAATGIQRMVRSVLNELKSNPPENFDIRTVVATRKKSYRYVDFDLKTFESSENSVMSVQKGDAFLALDLATHIIPSQHEKLIEWKAQGVAFYFIIYDLLPLLNGRWFSRKLAASFKRWIKEVAILSDSIICISRSVESDLIEWFDNRYNIPAGTIPTNVIPLGADILSSKPSSGLPKDFWKLIAQISRYKTALIVGTLEPRKGHLQILEAFEKLWENDLKFNLVFVGKKGWKTDALQKRISNHKELNNHLFWLSDASDQALITLYKACDGVIVASHAEGYGLPLIEAIEYNKPVLARDIPIFREHNQIGIDYFSDQDASDLENKIYQWLSAASDLQSFRLTSTFASSWGNTAKEILKIITKENPSINTIQKREFVGNLHIQ